MKRETTFLIAIALLVNAFPIAYAQDEELSDQDLQTLLEDNKAEPSEGKEVSEPKAAAPAAPSDSPVSEASSDTVDIQDLDSIDNSEETAQAPTEEPATTAETPPAEEPSQTLEALESSSGEEATAATVEASGDDLEALKSDLEGDGDFKPAVSDSKEESDARAKAKAKDEKKAAAAAATESAKKAAAAPSVFDVGREERDLLAVAKNIQGQISDNEWNEVATAAKVESYTVVTNDWLFKISKKIFGSGFFYPKIWSINSYITNPHFIEPGMVLSFTTGSGQMPPQVKLGQFTNDELNATPGSIGTANADDLANFGEDAKPKWLEEKGDLANQGVYFQYASEETMDDLNKAGAQALNREYENYEPPRSEFDVIIPSNYDKLGFDKNSKILYSFKEGFYLSTFVSTNIVQDFGEITNGPDENIFFTIGDRCYIKFDESINALPGDKFSIYSSNGKAKNANSDREGYKYAVVGQLKLLRKIKDKWEAEFFEVAGTPQRGDRVTTYTPKLERITATYNSRLIEAAILSTFLPNQSLLGFGDVIYLDRGRADGVEMGNVFEVFGFKDRLLAENITDQPTYKMGELTVITLTDNFATVIVTKTIRDFYVGDIAITKTKETYLREQKARQSTSQTKKELMGGKALEELDVELNLENLNDDLLKQADKIQLTEDELAELERQEREKSVIKDSEKDLKALERLENEIEQAETILNDAKLDEDKLLENENLNDIEKKQGNIDQDSLDEIEENMGKRYLDEDLNSKDNPYGLNEFDVEEVDELLNTEKKQQ
ncbi:MAG: LysM peptidoglycan-binding domain-containing protein [Bdellovibrionales bacterium]|nr:LysM peptidoglycan-binding domain-containing protein [Bdellovibrionales bacterium]